MNCIVVGIICLAAGGLMGSVCNVFVYDAKSIEEQEERNCNGCFGTSFGDCDRCPKNKGDEDEKDTNY